MIENRPQKDNKRKNNKNKKKFNWKMFCGFIIFQLVFAAVVGPILLFKGPFKQAKEGFVITATQTKSMGILATAFLSDEEIEEIKGGGNQQIDDSVYEDQTVEIDVAKEKDYEIQLSTLDLDGAEGYVLEIADPKRIRIGVSSDLGKCGEATSVMAEDAEAVAAVNGGAFYDGAGATSGTGTGAVAAGIVIQDGKVILADGGADHKHVCFGMTKDGTMLLGSYSANELLEKEVTQALTFDKNSVLVKDGRVVTNEGGNNPRTAIGQRKDGSIVLVVIDGRDFEKMELGVSPKEMALVMKEKLDVVNAYNLDGGKSSTMYNNGEIVNNPSEAGGERSIPTSVLVMPEE